MFIQGKVLKVFDIQTGESARGTWKKREFLVETFSKLPKKVNLCMRGEAVDSYTIHEGELLRINIDLESREHNGRWYTEVRAWKIEPAILSDEVTSVGSPPSEEDPF
jgi:hypothetical protein